MNLKSHSFKQKIKLSNTPCEGQAESHFSNFIIERLEHVGKWKKTFYGSYKKSVHHTAMITMIKIWLQLLLQILNCGREKLKIVFQNFAQLAYFFHGKTRHSFAIMKISFFDVFFSIPRFLANSYSWHCCIKSFSEIYSMKNYINEILKVSVISCSLNEAYISSFNHVESFHCNVTKNMFIIYVIISHNKNCILLQFFEWWNCFVAREW